MLWLLPIVNLHPARAEWVVYLLLIYHSTRIPINDRVYCGRCGRSGIPASYGSCFRQSGGSWELLVKFQKGLFFALMSLVSVAAHVCATILM